MHRSALVTLLISVVFLIPIYSQTTEIETTTAALLAESQVTESTPKNEEESPTPYIDMEIIEIEVLPKIGNTVFLSWGIPSRDYNLNLTFGVYYGTIMNEALREPKMTTTDLYAKVMDLEFCTQYIFAVGVVNSNSRIAHPAQNTRTIGTLIDELSSPENLEVEFIPDEQPCLLIKWSASCANIAVPIGYLITVQESDSPRLMLITHPRSTSPDLAQTLRVIYGKSYDIKVATDVVGSKPSPIVSYKVPHFLQPYKVRLTSRTDGAFMMYWREPYVPYYVGAFYYEVYVYPGRTLDSKPQIYETNRPVFQFQGNQSEYVFMVGLISENGDYKSCLTQPIVQNLLGENFTLSIS